MVKREKKFEAGAFGVKGGRSIGAIHGAVERGVCFGETEGHGDGIVKVGESCAAGLMFFALIQDRLRATLDFRAS